MADKKVFTMDENYKTEEYLELSRMSTMEHFCENVNCF